MLEEGLIYIDHQMPTAEGRRLDILMIDSGKSLVVAELKVVQDDGMLMQGIDYYDYVSGHIEAFARLYKPHDIDPTQQVRLFLIAPSFSQALVNRCKWFNLPISLFTFHCLKFEGKEDITPVFAEQEIPSPQEILKVVQLGDHLDYITDLQVRAKVTALLDEIKNWKPGSVSLDALQSAISMKVNGRVFAYFYPRRQHYLIGTYNDQEEWARHAISNDDNLRKVKPIIRAAMERRVK
ncbi:MAG: hypothetical protein ACYS6W_14265 [Planctomycetota bacterium]